MTEKPPPIVGVKEAADMAGLPRSHFRTLRSRGQVPEPQVVLACGPIWKRSIIEKWVKERAGG